MIQMIYVEEKIKSHPRTQKILAKFPKIHPILCKHAGEIFNRKSQNFRLQKQRPSLILAEKNNKFILKAPYGTGTEHNFYFSHMLNCVFDCRYCFLQGMFRSAHYLLYVNYEQFEEEILKTLDTLPKDSSVTFFSGYDCDSLALDHITLFTKHFLCFFSHIPQAYLELRTKSACIRSLKNHPPLKNIIVAFSLNPEIIIQNFEHKTPSLKKRLETIDILQKQGWKIGIRLDPLIYFQDFKKHYSALYHLLANQLNYGQLHSITLGQLRFPHGVYKNIRNLYPKEKLFSQVYKQKSGLVHYEEKIEEELLQSSRETLQRLFPKDKLFLYQN